jgi:hypothetical protein
LDGRRVSISPANDAFKDGRAVLECVGILVLQCSVQIELPDGYSAIRALVAATVAISDHPHLQVSSPDSHERIVAVPRIAEPDKTARGQIRQIYTMRIPDTSHTSRQGGGRMIRQAIRRAWAMVAVLILLAPASVTAQMPDPSAGAALELAQLRSANVSQLRYDMTLVVPRELSRPVTGTTVIRLRLADASRPLVIDFDAECAAEATITANGIAVPTRVGNGHLVIPTAAGREHTAHRFSRGRCVAEPQRRLPQHAVRARTGAACNALFRPARRQGSVDHHAATPGTVAIGLERCRAGATQER